MTYKLAIKDVVHVPIKIVFNDGASTRRFEFTLLCTRMQAEPLQAVLKNDDKKTAEFMQEVGVDWIGQRLVLDDAGEPAPFSQEALAVMLTAPGVANMAFSAYLGQVGRARKKLTEAVRLWALGDLTLPKPTPVSQDDELATDGSGQAVTGPQHILEGLAAIGLRPDGPITRPDEEYHLWPDNVLVFNLFMALQTQWLVGPSGPVGMNRTEMSRMTAEKSRRARRLGVAASKHELMAYLVAMESAALDGWAQRSERKSGSSAPRA